MTEWWRELPRTSASFPDLEILDSATSTNQLVKERAASAPDYCVLATSHQTRGRGRLGREWVSRARESLALSALLPKVSSQHQPWISLVTGAALVRALRLHGLANVEMKWPNDVLVDDAKLAGVLCEILPSGRVVAGVGLNIDFGDSLRPAERAIALSDFLHVSHGLVDDVVESALSQIRQWCEEEQTHAEDAARLLVEPVLGTLGRSVAIHEVSGESWVGVARELSPKGHLIVQVPNGSARTVIASDIEHLRQ